MSKYSFTVLPSITSLLCIFIYFTTTVPFACSNNETDFRALVAFRRAIVSDPQGALNSWNETVHFCSWQGVLCSRRHQNRVMEIDLMSQGLIGSISPYFGNLSFLRSINLQNNTFTGHIPNEIGRLRRLEQVEFSNNSLSGQIPSNLSQCTNINYLNLIDNNLTGNIPPELSSLVKLEALGLSVNLWSGTIPPFIGNFTHLAQLSLGYCGMQGEIPESLGQLKSLRRLTLDDNDLTGSVPPGLFNISTMVIFGIYLNRLEGTIPSDIGFTFPILRRLYLWDNLFTGEIPTSLSNISSLERLLLNYNMFTGRVNIDFSRLSALTYVFISNNNLEGDLSFIPSMVNCTQLINIDISSNQLSDSLPRSIANFSSTLSYLRFNRNQLHGRIPPGTGDLIGLIEMNLSNNDLDGALPSSIGNLNRLQALYLSGNNFTSEIPFSLGNLTSLVYLYLDRNNFTGNIQQSLSNCTNLLEFHLSYNNLNGPIPRQVMSRLSNSNIFDLSHNALTGSIPIEVGLLINLVVLDMSYNRLAGQVPNSLSTCVRLEEIYLQSNSFNGEIPNDLTALRGLQRVDLSQNNISGTIPTFLGELDLLYLNLSFNRLEGEVPSLGVFLNTSAVSLEGNNGLCGGIQLLNFTPCSRENSRKKYLPTVFIVLIPVIGVGAIAFACYCVFKCRRGKQKDSQTPMVAFEDEYVRISYADLLKSTSEFSESNLLGSGKFGSVYKGTLDNVQGYVAVKVLNLNVTGASKSFISECNVLRSTRHRNLVKIVSVCSSTDFQGNDFKALVFEYMVNGDLEQWLHQKPMEDSRGTLSLRQRFDIIADIASAVEYLHFGTDSTIVHGDLKPSNVLLDEKMTARVGDFGLAKIISNILSTTNESSSVAVRGTVGYIPPEYGMGGNVSTHGDVYSYGVLLLEMFTGKRPTNDIFKDSWSLPVFVRSGLSREVIDIFDPIILEEYKKGMDVELKKCVVSVLEIGLACTVELPGDRMDMTDVVNRLCEAIQMAG